MPLTAAARGMAGLTAGRASTHEAKQSAGCPAPRRLDPVLAAAQGFWQLPDDELDQLLTLSRETDRVELKLTVRESAHDAACAALGVDFARVRAHRVYYLDTEDRALHRH